MKILVLEASTSSAKAMLIDSKSLQCVVKTREYEHDYEDVGKHDAEHVYRQVMSLGKEVAGGTVIDVISLVGAWHSVVLCNRKAEPVSPLYDWTNTEPAIMCQKLRNDKAYTDDYFNRIGCMVNAIYPFFKLKWFVEEKKMDLSQYMIMGQSSYNTYRMTGKKVVTDCMASASGLLNIHRRELDEKCLKELGLTKENFCEVIDYNHTYPLTREAADLLGLTAGIPVIPANSDGGCNQVGAGALKEGVMTLSIGTSGAVRLTSKSPKIPDKPGTWLYYSPKAWLSGASTNGCCNCLDWFKQAAFPQGTSYEMIEAKLSEDRDTPVFLPFMFGERCPGWNDERRGGFEGLQPHHNLYDMYLAVQEGILFNLFHCYRLLTELNGEPEEIKLSGGILKSEKWTQMCADIFQKEMEVDESEQSSLTGGAVLAMEIMGEIEWAEDYENKITSVVYPNTGKKELYQKKFSNYLRYYNMSNHCETIV